MKHENQIILFFFLLITSIKVTAQISQEKNHSLMVSLKPVMPPTSLEVI
jgi:hypothetical protein